MATGAVTAAGVVTGTRAGAGCCTRSSAASTRRRRRSARWCTTTRRSEDRIRAAKASAREVRGDLGAAVRGSVLDEAALGAVLGRIDAATAEARAALVDAMRNLHGLLDDRQRAQVADLLEASVRHGWAEGGGPYRM